MTDLYEIQNSALYARYLDAFNEVQPGDYFDEELQIAYNATQGTIPNPDIHTDNLRGAFMWKQTPQGYYYWKAVFDKQVEFELDNEADYFEKDEADETESVVEKPKKKKKELHFVITPMNVCFTYGSDQYTVDATSPNFSKIVMALTKGKGKKAVKLIDVASSINEFMQGHVEVSGGVVKYKGLEINGGMTDRILAAMSDGNESKVEHLVTFFENLMENPSNRAVNELFGFLEANDIKITEDGYFIAWKKVKSDYKDIYTGRMDNSPGNVVSVPRNMVDENSDQTCSYGLHVCSKSYLNHYGTSYGNKVVACKVHPKDVVAVPRDYENAKLRCSGYIVLKDVTDEHNG